MNEGPFDGIVIGAGHNGLITASYLARAGMSVAVFEARPNVGGGFSTEEVTLPGFKHNLHTIHSKIHESPAHGDLELDRYGVSYLFPQPKMAFVRHDEYFVYYQGTRRNYESISRISRKDAETYRKVTAKWHQWYLDFILPELYSAPKPPDEWESEIRKQPGGEEYLSVVLGLSPVEYAAHLFESELCRLAVVRAAASAEYSPATKGIPAIVFAHIVNWFAGKTALVRGGTRSLAEALARYVEDHGGRVHMSHGVSRILVEGGVARGVVLEDGREIRARRFVASSIDPVHTFLFMIDEGELPESIRDRVAEYQFSETSIFRVHLALRERPRFTIAEREPDINNAWKFTIGFESPGDFVKMGEQASSGEIPDALGLDAGLVSFHDPSQAPSGCYTAYVGIRAPFELRDGGADRWASVASDVAERLLRTLREYAPNMTDENVLGKFAYSPKDIEQYLPDMVSADVCQGKICPEQLGHARPWPGMSTYRTPIEKLYLCGSCTHPGGHAIGAPGYNAANAIADDLGIEKWWRPYVPRRAVPDLVD